MKKMTAAVMMTLALAGSIFAGCGTKPASETKGSTEAVQETPLPEMPEGGIVNPEQNDIDAKCEELVQEENAIMTEHIDLWNKVLDKVDNESAQEQLDNGKAYIDCLKEAYDKAKADMTEEEKKVIEEDMLKIEKIEKQIEELLKQGEQK